MPNSEAGPTHWVYRVIVLDWFLVLRAELKPEPRATLAKLQELETLLPDHEGAIFPSSNVSAIALSLRSPTPRTSSAHMPTACSGTPQERL